MIKIDLIFNVKVSIVILIISEEMLNRYSGFTKYRWTFHPSSLKNIRPINQYLPYPPSNYKYICIPNALIVMQLYNRF